MYRIDHLLQNIFNTGQPIIIYFSLSGDILFVFFFFLAGGGMGGGVNNCLAKSYNNLVRFTYNVIIFLIIDVNLCTNQRVYLVIFIYIYYIQCPSSNTLYILCRRVVRYTSLTLIKDLVICIYA